MRADSDLPRLISAFEPTRVDLGVRHFLSKPYAADLLLQTLRQVIEGRVAYVDEAARCAAMSKTRPDRAAVPARIPRRA